MKNHFIPVNTIDKALAFAPSLSAQYRQTQRIKTKENYIETADVLIDLSKNGWIVEGVCENLNKKDRKVEMHYAKLYHPDLAMKNDKGHIECVSNIYISNSCNGKNPMKFDFGMYRQVCSNGLMRFDGQSVGSISHSEKGAKQYQTIMGRIDELAMENVNKFDSLKNKELSPEQIRRFTNDAFSIRFSKADEERINQSQLTEIHRPEDQGNTLWSVFNRVQENLTKPSMLVDVDGKVIGGVNNIKQDFQINQDLFRLVESYALN
jgi:hypothetical protein